MESLNILFSITIIFILGILVVLICNYDFRKTPLLLLGISYSVGIYIIVGCMFLFNILSWKWNASGLYILIFFILFFAFSYITRIKKKIILKSSRNYLSKVSLFLIIMITFTLLITFIESQMRPVSAWDAIATWYMGGKAFFSDRLMSGSFYEYINFDAPPLTHLLLAFINIYNSNFNDTFSLLFFYVFFPCLLIIFYYSLRQMYSVRLALLFTFLLASSQNFIRHAGRFDIGNADLPLSYFMLISVFLVQNYNQNKTFGNLALAAITLACCALTKNDGLPFCLVGLVILSVLGLRTHGIKIIGLVLLISPIIYWRIFTIINHFPPSYLPFLNIQIERTWGILIFMLKEMINITRWNLLWIFFLCSMSFIVNVKRNFIVFIFIIAQFGSYYWAYLVTPIPYKSHIENSFDRLLLQIAPICLYFAITLIFKPTKIKYNKNHGKV